MAVDICSPMDYCSDMKEITIKTTPAFERKAKKLLTQKSLEELFDFLVCHPEQGDLIQGTGGVRKLRWRSGKDNRGKSGGVRVLYHYSKNILIVLITLYSKTEQEDITAADRNELKRLMPALISKYKEDL